MYTHASDGFSAPPAPPLWMTSGGVPRVPNFSEFRQSLVKLYRNERADKTAWRINHTLRQLECLGCVALRDCTREKLSEWRKSVESLAPTTQKSYYSAICSALSYAEQSGWIPKSPTKIFPMRFSGRKLPKKRHLSWEETGRLFEVLSREASNGWKEHRLFALAVVIFSTGMRAGEAQRLKVAEIDLSRGLIDLTQRSLKTAASSGYVALPDSTCDVLAKWLPNSQSEWAFPHCFLTGPWVSGSQKNKPVVCLQAAGKRAGIEHVTFAMGRHGFVTHGQQRLNLTREQIQTQTRHTTVFTQDHYAHFDAENARLAVASIRLPGISTTEGERHGQAKAHTA